MAADRLIGAIAVTVPSCAFLLQPGPDKGHGHHDSEHEGKSHEEGDATPEDGDDSEAEGEEKDETQSSDDTSGSDEDEGKSEESSGEGEEQQNTPDTSDDEEGENETQLKDGGGDVEGVRGKGATKEGKPGDTRKSYPDAKGGNKKRIESDYGKKQAEDPEGVISEDGKVRDKVRPRLASRQERYRWYVLTDNIACSLRARGRPKHYVWQASRIDEHRHQAFNRRCR